MRNWHIINHPRLFSKPLLQSLVPLAERRGVPASRLFKSTSLTTTTDWQLSNHRISLKDWFQVVHNAERFVQDPQVWPLVAQTIIHERLSPLAELALQAPHLFDVLKQLQHYHQLIQPLEFGVARGHEGMLDIYFLPSCGAVATSSILSVSILLTIAQQRGLAIHQWQLKLPASLNPLPQWSRWFENISEGAFVSVRIPQAQLFQPLPHEPDYYRQAQAFCRMRHREAKTPSALTHTLRWSYRCLQQQQQLSIHNLAVHMQLSVSSCKRMLAQHQSSFQQCVDTMRLFRMVELLQQQPYNNSQLAAQLGYSNSNNLRRACKRWLGENPARLREILT